MKIECDKCQAKYSIADEKVRGKTFKIRCKKCSNVIIVRDKASAAGAEAAKPAAAEEPPGWHLAVDGETVGPVPEDDVRRRYDAGEIDKETSVWQEGFEDWITLGEVELFADLPDREPAAPAEESESATDAFAGGGEDDAFAGGGDDAFSGGGDDAFSGGGDDAFSGGGLGAAPAAAPMATEPAAADSSLTGQRNENSVLFSLDNLQAIASGGGGSAAPLQASPATSAPSSEGSGLIDIRAMGAMLGGDGGGGGGELPDFGSGGRTDDDIALPSFGGGFGGLAAEPLAPETPADLPAAPPPPQKSNAPMYAIIGVLALGLIGLGTMMALKEDPAPQVITKIVEVPGQVKADDAENEKDKEDEEDKEDKDTQEEEAKGVDTGGDAEGVAGSSKSSGSKSPGKSGRSKSKSKSKSKSSGGSGGSAPAPTPTPAPQPKASGGGGAAADVDCLLDPDLPKCKKKKKSGGSKPAASAPSDAPAKLDGSAIKAAMAPIKPKAKACGPKNGAVPGTKVAVKFSVAGASGSVTSAVVTGDFAGKPLGSCVAKVAKTAKFPKFQKASQGFTFKFRM